MLNNNAVKNNLKKREVDQMQNIIETSTQNGMISMKQYAKKLLERDNEDKIETNENLIAIGAAIQSYNIFSIVSLRYSSHLLSLCNAHVCNRQTYTAEILHCTGSISHTDIHSGIAPSKSVLSRHRPGKH